MALFTAVQRLRRNLGRLYLQSTQAATAPATAPSSSSAVKSVASVAEEYSRAVEVLQSRLKKWKLKPIKLNLAVLSQPIIDACISAVEKVEPDAPKRTKQKEFLECVQRVGVWIFREASEAAGYI